MRRQLVLLLIVSAATAAAVAYYIGKRSRQALGIRDEWLEFGEPGSGTPAASGSARAARPATEEEAPTEAPAIVVATMEATPTGADARFEGNGFEGNGSGSVVVESEPAKAGSEAALGSIGLGSTHMPRKQRLSGVTLAVLGALAGAGAIALGAWGVASSISGDDHSTAQTPVALQNVGQVVSLISKPSTATIPIQGSGRRIILVVGARGYGVLVLNNVGTPPAGKTYEAWVIKPNVKAPQPAGLFSGGTGVVKLTKPVPAGAVVAITVEKAGGVPAPTSQPKLLATRT